ncbi:signal peptidase I [Nitratiruptor sp. SB155-2]|uniref:signal peptidase I n=1 Tax=Nitratiruptor sp. (strain SB155-2) TaxID=387092 RepID=UPI00015872A5|nr:signal peptidase I [Nitratiruptor sp. SB155-2]BAF69824.1 signal peptidase I [Nitratiruptor sp. SB155-2]
MKEKLKKFYHWSNTWTGTIVIVLLVIFFIAQAFVIPSGSMKNTLLIGDHLFVKKFTYGIPTPHIPWLEIPVLPDLDGDGHLIEGPKPKRGDIVIFRYPVNPKIHYVKRCVALGGDEILFQNERLLIHFHEGDDWIRKHYPKNKIVTISGKLWVVNPYMDAHPGIHYDPQVDTFRNMLLYYMNKSLAMEPVIVEGLPPYDPQIDVNAFYFKVPKGQFFMMGDNRDHSNDSRFWGPVPYKLIVGKPWFIYWSWDENYVPRWERVGKTVSQIEEAMREIESGNH